jgi:HEAT repeat protein
MDYAEFQYQYEEQSRRLYKQFLEMSEDELIQLIENQKFDSNYQIWRALGDKGSKKSIRCLFEIVSNLNNEYLVRYHACSALFKIANINDLDLLGRVQHGRNKHRQKTDQKEAIEKLRTILINWLIEK